MKAVTRSVYGGPEVLSIREKDIPQPKPNEILIRVHAATVSRTDCGILWGKPFLVRFFTGLPRPESPVPGTDFAGTVEAVGKDVVLFKVRDRVFGFNDQGLGSHAQYMTIREDKAVARIPYHLSFAEAAASPEGAHYAFNFVNKVKLKPGDKVLVNGATGAIGSAAVQILKFLGVHVTATCATPYIDRVKVLGADRVIDYTREDFTRDKERYGFVFDAVGKSTFGACKRLLVPRGIYISSELGPRNENPFLAMITPLLGGKKVIFPLPVNIKASMAFIIRMMEAEKFKPLIDRHYPMDKIGEAYEYVVSGQKIGNVILDMD